MTENAMLAKRSSSAVFSLVSADSNELDEEDMLREAMEVDRGAPHFGFDDEDEDGAGDGNRQGDACNGLSEDSLEARMLASGTRQAQAQLDQLGSTRAQAGLRQRKQGRKEEEDEEDDGEDEEGESSEYGGEMEESGDDFVDAGLAAAQDSVKTVITQSFRACAFAADSVASLVLRAHDYNNAEAGPASPLGQAAGASSAEIKTLDAMAEDDGASSGIVGEVEGQSTDVMTPATQSVGARRSNQPAPIREIIQESLRRHKRSESPPQASRSGASSYATALESLADGAPSETEDGRNAEGGAGDASEHRPERAIEREEKRLMARQQLRRTARELQEQQRLHPSGVSSEAFAALFQELDDSAMTVSSSSNNTPRRMPSDYHFGLVHGSGSDGDLPGTAGGMYFEEDSALTDSDAYTEVGSEGRRAQQRRLGQSDGLMRVSVRAISSRLSRPIRGMVSLFSPRGSVDGGEEWRQLESPASGYFLTPPITPFGMGAHRGPGGGGSGGGRGPLGGFRSSLRKVSLGSFNSIKDALTSWRHSRKPLHLGGPVPSAATRQSGLFEDIEMFLLERVDLTFYAARTLARRLKRSGRRLYADRYGARGSEAAAVGGRGANGTARPESGGDSRRSRGASACKSLTSFVGGMVTLRIPRRLLGQGRRGASKLLFSPFSYLQSATRRFVHLDNVDELQGVGEIVRRQGYPYQEIFVCTRDGYILPLERLPNPGSKKVLFMQHGVMDSSFTWVANGADGSLAFRAHDAGYDVFLGNFRGAGGEGARRHVKTHITEDEYWDFSINEHAFEDIPAFVNAIVRTKMSEFSSLKETGVKPNIVAVAHSMGGAAMIMYVLNQRQKKLRHYLDGMVLVSPAGIHVQSPLYARVGGRAVDLTVARLVNSLRLPTDALTRAAVKITQDIKNSVPALEDIISLVVVYALGGDRSQPRHGPFSAVQQLTYNVLTCGTSTKVYTHLRQFIASKRFRAFDYEPTAYPNHFKSKKGGNMEHYGTPEPPEYTTMYHLLDLPVHLIAGLGDRLIGPTNVLRHYDVMKRQGVDVTLESFERCGHADFTCGLHSGALLGILRAVDKTMERSQSNKQRMQQLQKKQLITAHPAPAP